MSDNAPVTVEVVLAMPDRQALRRLALPAESSVGSAIAASGLAREFPEVDVASCEVAVWGKQVSRETTLSDGDRVEILRVLEMDPRDARRQLAMAGKFMGHT